MIGLLIIGDHPPCLSDRPSWQPPPGSDAETARQSLVNALSAQDRGEGVVLISEENQGRAINLAISLLRDGGLDLVTGANRAMIDAAETAVETAADRRAMAQAIRDAGRNAMVWYSDFEMIT